MATDSYKFELTGLKKFSMGDCGAAGAMGGSLTDFLVKDGTAKMNLTEPKSTDVFIYQSDSPYASLSSNQPKDISFEVMGLKLSQLPKFLGGAFVASVGAVKDKWTAPVTIPDLIQSCKFESEEGSGKTVYLSFPRCKITASMTGSLSKDDLIGLQVKILILTPVDGSGNPLPAWFVEGESAS